MFGWQNAKRAELAKLARHTQQLLDRIKVLLNDGNAEEVLPLCQELVAFAPQNYDAWMHMSWAYHRLKRYRESLEACEHALSINSQRGWAWENKGIALVHLKRYEEALEAARHIPFTTPAYVRDIMWICGAAYEELHRHEELLADANYWIEHAPQEPLSWRWLGVALFSLERYEGALDAFRRATELEPNDANYWESLVRTLYDLKRYEEVIKICERRLPAFPQSGFLWTAKGLSLAKGRRYNEACSTFEHLLTLPIADCATYYNYGYVLFRAGRYADAALALTRCLVMKPDHANSLNMLGCVYLRLQYHEHALSIFARALAVDAHLAYVWINIAEVLICLGRYDEAKDRLEKAREVETAHPTVEQSAYAAAWLGILHTRERQFDQALAAFKEAFTIDADSDEARMGFAELLLALGETEKAIDAIEKAMPLNAYDARVWSLKARILRAASDDAGAAEAERHGAELLSQQRAELAEFEREHPEWANFGKEG